MSSENSDARAGTSYQIRDYVSNQPVKATPEEIEAVQVFSRRLCEDYGYPKTHMQTRPQFRVRKRPSDDAKAYPVDIAVFKSDVRSEDQLFLVVECKKNNRKEGIAQLKLYLDMSSAELGVWFNGVDHVYVRKVFHKDGLRTYEEIPSIPRFGQRIEDIGRFKRKDLKKPSNLKAIFRDIRNHLAGNVLGITRDEALAQEIISVLFCKIYDEVNTPTEGIVTFRAGHDEPARAVQDRVMKLFERKVKQEYADVFVERDSISLDADSLLYVVGELQNFCIIEADRDAIGDAFEVFIGPALRGSEGQFFTPRNVVRMIIDVLNPDPGEMILDPACGSGGFLIMALEHVWRKLETEAKAFGWSPVQLERRKRDVATRFFRGLDKDSFLAKVTKAYMAIIGDGRGAIFCENSLLTPTEWSFKAQEAVKLGTFDLVLTNPPFGSKIPIKGARVLSQYDLGHKWKKSKTTGEFQKIGALHEDQPPQIIFLERCLQFLRQNGRLGIVLPESLLGNPSYEYVLNWLERQTKVLAVVTLPESLFKTSGKGGTHTKVCVLFLEKAPPSTDEDYEIFMASAKWCGHDSRGNPTIRKNASGCEELLDDVPTIARKFWRSTSDGTAHQDRLGFWLKKSNIRNQILVPKYYDPELLAQIDSLRQSHRLLSISGLVRDGVVSITTGVEVGKMAYGTGPIPFIRTSDISNWELKADPKQGISRDLYESLKEKTDVRVGDILMVRDGTYLIGTSAIVTDSDTEIVFQSHIYKIRVLKPEILDPWLFFAALNSPVVKRQIRAKQFTQDIIDTLGNRILEIVVPIPRNSEPCTRIAKETRETVEARAALRNKARDIALEIEGATFMVDDEEEILRIF